MKCCIEHVAVAISNLINLSFTTGCFPNQLKIAKICPIFKNGSKEVFSNYRPISVLPSFSKIFEKAAYIRIQSYINANDILTKRQYGFRPKHSTAMAVLDMCDKVKEAIDDHLHSIGIFVDLSKAFDTINHNILFAKLEHYGFRGLVLKWFVDYLTNRKQYVIFNHGTSSLLDIVCGVPQGSILGPLLFIIYVNDIINCSETLSFILFADDTNLFYSTKDVHDLMNTVNSELSKLYNWFCSNKLSN